MNKILFLSLSFTATMACKDNRKQAAVAGTPSEKTILLAGTLSQTDNNNTKYYYWLDSDSIVCIASVPQPEYERKSS